MTTSNNAVLVHIEGLVAAVNEQDLVMLFKQWPAAGRPGIKRKDGKSVGTGHIRFSCPRAAFQAVGQLNGTLLKGRKIGLRVRHNPPPSSTARDNTASATSSAVTRSLKRPDDANTLSRDPWLETFDAALGDDSPTTSVVPEKLVRFAAPDRKIVQEPSQEQYSFTISGMSQDVLIELMRFGILQRSVSYGYEVHVMNGKTQVCRFQMSFAEVCTATETRESLKRLFGCALASGSFSPITTEKVPLAQSAHFLRPVVKEMAVQVDLPADQSSCIPSADYSLIDFDTEDNCVTMATLDLNRCTQVTPSSERDNDASAHSLYEPMVPSAVSSSASSGSPIVEMSSPRFHGSSLSPSDQSFQTSTSSGPPDLSAGDKPRLMRALFELDGLDEATSKDQESILNILSQLPKKQRLLCIFNSEYMHEKVRLALAILQQE